MYLTISVLTIIAGFIWGAAKAELLTQNMPWQEFGQEFELPTYRFTTRIIAR